MIELQNGTIAITRGDDHWINVHPMMKPDDPQLPMVEYVLEPGDKLTLTVREKPSEEFPVIFSVTSDSNTIFISKNDTTDCPIGKFSADIQLDRRNGQRVTIYPKLDDKHHGIVKNWKNFIIDPEVTRP